MGEDWVKEKEKDELKKRRQGKSRQERRVRDAFRDYLRKQYEEDKMTMDTTWRNYVPSVVDANVYTALIGLEGSTPHDIFDDFIEELNDRYREDRAKIKKCAKAKGLVVTSTSTYDWFHSELQGEDGFEQISKANRHSVFYSLVAKAKEQDAESEKNAKRNRKNFVELLQKTRDISGRTSYDEAKKLLK